MKPALNFAWLVDSWKENREPYLEAWRHAGWPIRLWHCGQLERAPVAGVELVDARPIVDASPIRSAFEYEASFGNHAPCADLFRYELLWQHGGCYSDIDIVPAEDAGIELLDGKRLLFEYDDAQRRLEIRFIAAPARHEVLQRLRDRAVALTDAWIAAGGYTSPADIRGVLARTGPDMAEREVRRWGAEAGLPFDDLVSRRVVFAETTVNRSEHFSQKWPTIRSRIVRKPFSLFRRISRSE